MAQVTETKSSLVKPQITEVVDINGQISKINFQLDLRNEGKIPLYLFGLMNEFLEAKNYVTINPILTKKNQPSRNEILEVMKRLEDMEELQN